MDDPRASGAPQPDPKTPCAICGADDVEWCSYAGHLRNAQYRAYMASRAAPAEEPRGDPWEVLARLREGYSNLVEFGILPPQYFDSARELIRQADAALAGRSRAAEPPEVTDEMAEAFLAAHEEDCPRATIRTSYTHDERIDYVKKWLRAALRPAPAEPPDGVPLAGICEAGAARPAEEGERMRTVVRFRHGATRHRPGPHNHPWPSKPPDVGGLEVAIYLPPVVPDYGWACDTEWVWRIPDDEVERLTGFAPAAPMFVCEHQVELD